MRRYAAMMVLLLVSALAHAIPVSDVPTPFSTPGEFVVDQGGVMGPEYGSLVTNISQQLRDKTGHELVVITVDNLDGLTVDDYAEQLFKRLGIGEKGKDNGVLILLSRDDRKVRIEVGYGLESVLNDAKAGRLLDEHAVPFLHEDQFGRGLYEGAKAVAFTLADVAHSPLVISEPNPWPVQPVVTLGVAPGKTQVVALAMALFASVLTVLAVLGKAFMMWRRKTRDGRIEAMSVFDNITATLVILAPLATVMVGYSEGVLWTGILFAFIPLAWGLFVYFGFRRWAHRIAKWSPKCASCHGPMDYQKTETTESPVEEGKKVRVAEKCEFWKCSQCGADTALVDIVYMGKRSSSGWSYSRPSSGSGRSGGGSSGGGGASRGF